MFWGQTFTPDSDIKDLNGRIILVTGGGSDAGGNGRIHLLLHPIAARAYPSWHTLTTLPTMRLFPPEIFLRSSLFPLAHSFLLS